MSKDKEALEKDKLELEIEHLSLKWWKRPAYISPFVTVAIAILTFTAGILSGFFDAERVRLKASKAELEISVNEAKKSLIKLSILQSIAKLNSEWLREKAIMQVEVFDKIEKERYETYTWAENNLEARVKPFIDEQKNTLNKLQESGDPKAKDVALRLSATLAIYNKNLMEIRTNIDRGFNPLREEMFSYIDSIKVDKIDYDKFDSEVKGIINNIDLSKTSVEELSKIIEEKQKSLTYGDDYQSIEETRKGFLIRIDEVSASLR